MSSLQFVIVRQCKEQTNIFQKISLLADCKLSLLLNQAMQKSKSGLSQTKSKQKIVQCTPVTKKSTTKTRDKISPCSPRATQTKASPTIPKKARPNEHESPSPLTPNNNSTKGYETPKFKCEPDPAVPAKAALIHNFFSFGEKENDKGRGREKEHGAREGRQTREGRETRQINRVRKEQRLR